ncbi:MAG: hypothetical protein AAF674_11125 [Pseudomonadota bacterium]
MSLEFTPVVILGAVRSGINMLRKVLVGWPALATWDCDESNPIWRHGNLDWPPSQISPQRATPAITSYIRCAFRWIWRIKAKHAFVVETACANTRHVG